MKLRHGAQAVGGSTFFLLCMFLTQETERLKKRENLAKVNFTYV